MGIILEVKNLEVKLNGEHILRDLSFSVQKSDVVAIVGPNGAGKSVLFKALLDLIPYSGSIKWAENLKISYIPQKLFIEKDLPLSVGEFLKSRNKSSDSIIEVLKSVGMGAEHKEHPDHWLKHITEHILKQRLGWLSGGEFQRTMVAWALLDNPDVLLFDEPTAGIDIGGEETIYNLLKKLKDERNMTVIIISHDLNIVYKYANNVLCLNKIKICFGLPAEVLDPTSLVKLYGGEAAFYAHEHRN